MQASKQAGWLLKHTAVRLPSVAHARQDENHVLVQWLRLFGTQRVCLVVTGTRGEQQSVSVVTE